MGRVCNRCKVSERIRYPFKLVQQFTVISIVHVACSPSAVNYTPLVSDFAGLPLGCHNLRLFLHLLKRRFVQQY